MTTSIESHEHDLAQLVKIARAGEEVVVTEKGHAIAKITALPIAPPVMANESITESCQPGWLGKSAARAPRKAPPGAIKAWMERARELAASSATGKRGMTSDEIIDELRSERN